MRWWGGVIAVLLGSSRAQAQDLAGLEELLDTKVVSTASRQAETSSQAPATISTISSEELRRHGIRTLDEALNFLSLGVVSTNPLHSVEVGARGVLITADYGNHMLVLVNGHMLNDQWSGTAYYERGLGVPIELIDHIEVVLGPGSVLYGSSAMLGVIHVFTKKASEFKGLSLVGEAELLTSGRLGLGFGRSWTMGTTPVEVTGQIEYFAQKGPTFSFGPQRYGADSVTGLPKRFSADPAQDGTWGGKASDTYTSEVPTGYLRAIAGPFELNARATSYTRRTPYINLFNQFIGAFNDPYSREQDRMFSVDLRYTRVLSSRVDLSLRAYGDSTSYAQNIRTFAPEDCPPGGDSGCSSALRGGSRWVGLEPQLKIDWRRDGRWTTLLGVDTRLRNYSSDLTFRDLASSASISTIPGYDRTELFAGAYLQQTARPAEALSLNAGVRLDADQRFGVALSPRGVAALSPWRDATFKLIYSEAFRAPTGYELFYTDQTYQIQAESLRPERERSVEATFEQRFGTHRLFSSLFRTWWRDLISLDIAPDEALDRALQSGSLPPGTTSALQYRNVGEIDNFGWNLAYDGSLLRGKLRLGLSATGAYADRHGAGLDQPLTVTPFVFGNARASYDLGGSLPVLGLAVQQTGPAYVDRAFDGGFSPPPRASGQTSLRAAISGPMPAIKNLSYRLTASWARVDRSPYVVGPIQAATAEHPTAELAPVDTFRTAVALYYALDPLRSSWAGHHAGASLDAPRRPFLFLSKEPEAPSFTEGRRLPCHLGHSRALSPAALLLYDPPSIRLPRRDP